jgi:preprotein translocase subunit SecF
MMRHMRRGGFHIDFIGRARLWFMVSAGILVVSATSLAFRQLNAGLEFRGGTAFQFEAKAKDVKVQDVRTALEDVGVHDETVQAVGRSGFLVQTPHLTPKVQARVVSSLSEVADVRRNDINVTDVGPKWGAQITNKAIRALLIFLVVVVVYLSIRLEPKMAGAALVALFHDLVATAGIYSLTGFEVTPATVIALLTILGYSLYDTVVIFDRVKDRTATLSAAGRITYSQAANASLNQVLVRSVNTSVVSLLPVGSLLFVGSYLLGAQTLRELALALFIGIGIGTYSSIFVATPLLAIWKEREQRWATLRARIGARAAEAPRPVVPAPVAAPVAAPPAQPATVQQSQPGVSSGSGGGSRQRRRKKRKRRRR